MLKFRLGLFENPFVDPDLAVQTVHTNVHQDVPLTVAREGIVLLKNERRAPNDEETNGEGRDIASLNLTGIQEDLLKAIQSVESYIDVSAFPLWEFGFGLSYTGYDYANLRITPEEIGSYGEIKRV